RATSRVLSPRGRYAPGLHVEAAWCPRSFYPPPGALALCFVIGAARRGKIGSILQIGAEELIQQRPDVVPGGAVRLPGPGDEIVEPVLESTKLVNARDGQCGVGGIEGVGIDLMPARINPETFEIRRSRIVV